MELNKEQEAAVKNVNGYELVLAGAGSGKTGVLTNRYIYLVNHGVLTENILAITFTRKAADEMRSRISNKMDDDYDGSLICTFHGFCYRLLKEDGHAINISKSFNLHDESQTKRDICLAIAATKHTSEHIKLEDAKAYIHSCKDEVFAEEYIQAKTSSNSEYLHTMRDADYEDWRDKMFWEYLYIQNEDKALDFDDLIILGLELLERNRRVRTKWQERLEYIMIDEYQDVSKRQNKLAAILSGLHKNLMVVGDANQTIYTFRGANIKYILSFDKLHKPCFKVEMNRNYRSFQPILDAANELIKYNGAYRSGISLVADREGGEKPQYYHAKTTEKEHEWICSKIKELKKPQGEYDYSDMAVLCRRNDTAQEIQQFFVNHGIPSVLMTDQKFYDIQVIREAIAYLRMVYDPNNNDAFILSANVPSRRIGKITIAALSKYAEENGCSLFEALKANINITKDKTAARNYYKLIELYHKQYEKMTLTELADRLWTDSGFDDTQREDIDTEDIQNIDVLRNVIHDFEDVGEPRTLEELLEYFQKHMEDDDLGNRVQIGTIHSAKGLEFPVVFIPNFVRGSLPSSQAKTPAAIREERRLCYVAVTRAMDKLYITDSEGRQGAKKASVPSGFLFEFGDTIDYLVKLPDKLVREAKMPDKETDEAITLLVEGTRVEHEFNGEGTIIDVDESAYLIKFDKFPVPKRRSHDSVKEIK